MAAIEFPGPVQDVPVWRCPRCNSAMGCTRIGIARIGKEWHDRFQCKLCHHILMRRARQGDDKPAA
jgi:transposase-like protein